MKSMMLHFNKLSILHNNKNFKCQICDVTFSQNHRLMLHIATVHEERKPNNSDVQVVSYKFKDLNDQNKTTIRERKDTVNEVHEEKMQPMKCSYCNEEFPGMARLNQHIGDFHNESSNFDTNNEDVSSKGLLISKCPFGVKTSSKKQTNFLPGFLP